MDSEIPRFQQHHPIAEVDTYLHMYIRNLNTNDSIGVKFTSHVEIVAINNLKIGHIESRLILFKGVSIHSNAPIELLQHIVQISLQVYLGETRNPP